MDIAIKKLSIEDIDYFSALIHVFEVVFEIENFKIPKNEYLQWFLAKTDFFALVAEHDQKVIGELTVYIIHQYYAPKPSAYIYDLGVCASRNRRYSNCEFL